MDSRPAQVYPRIVNASAVRQDAHAGDSPDGSVGSTGEPTATLRPPGPSRRSISIRGARYPVLLPSIRDARLHVAAVTITVHILGQIGLGFQLSVPQIVAAMATSASIELAITFRTRKAFVWPASALLTGSGVALILRLPTTPVGDHWTFHKWWVYAGVAGFSVLTKYLVRYRGSPFFNPSNVGLVLTFVVFGSARVEPLDFWWSPLDAWMVAAYAVIIVGGTLITARLRLLAGAVVFWLTLAAGTGLTAAFGHCMTARWAFAPVCGLDYWTAIVASPEVLIFMFFMITDPKTVPRGRVGHVTFCFLVGLASLLLMAPQSTEYWAKVGLLGGLTVMCALRPLLERMLPERDTADDHIARLPARLGIGRGQLTPARRAIRIALVSAAAVAMPAAVVAAGVPAREPAVADSHSILGRVPHDIDPSTMPRITVDQDVLDWNHEISGAGAAEIVLILVENLELENQALLRSDESVLEAVDHGDRLDDMLARLRQADATGVVPVHHYRIETVDVTLLVPFGRQDGLSLGLRAQGTVQTSERDAGGTVTTGERAPFATTFVMRRATGDRWLIVAELPFDEP
jgi:hypothetical protein